MVEPLMSASVAHLLDEAAIREVLARYCRAMDRMDRDLALSVWHHDGTCNYVDFFEGTADGFIDAVWAAHSQMSRHSHQIASSLIKINGDRAASETYVTATLWGTPSEDGTMEITSKGRYLDRWSRRDSRWAIDDRMHVGDMTTTRVIPPGARFGGDGPATRDPSDPSYELFREISERTPDRGADARENGAIGGGERALHPGSRPLA